MKTKEVINNISGAKRKYLICPNCEKSEFEIDITDVEDTNSVFATHCKCGWGATFNRQTDGSYIVAEKKV